MEQIMESSIKVEDLPMSFQVKYLGSRPARGLWGIKHTRKPVNDLVNAAKELSSNQILPIVKVEVNKDNLNFYSINEKKSKGELQVFNIDTISYGVQDLIFTRIFCMIIVREQDQKAPFLCHAFVCDSKNQARKLTYALAAAFQNFAKKCKTENNGVLETKRFAIDLRTPQQMLEEDEVETEA